MASPKDSLSRWHRSNPNQLVAIGTAILVIGVSMWVGFLATRASAELATRRDAWQQTSNQLATVQQQFRTPTSTESAALIAESARLGALGVPSVEKLSLLESVGRLAEACALTRVRVNAATADSVYTPPRAIGTQAINPAGYVVTLEFSGSFAGVVQFVSSLPPSVSVSRLKAARQGGTTTYLIVLSVYELDANPAG